MPVKWKKTPRFKPDLILQRIQAVRTINPDGKGSSFSGWELNQSLPLLNSMLDFPEAARGLNHANLIWRAVAYTPQDLTSESFIKEINRQLSAALSKREENFHVLTAVSITNRVPMGTMTVEGVKLNYCGATYPRRFTKTRAQRIARGDMPAIESPFDYSRVVATVTAKEPRLALSAALRAIDLQRALWCFFCNTEMEIIGRSWVPINAIQLAAVHTVHSKDGGLAGEEIWFEPYHSPTRAFVPKDAGKMKRKVQGILSRLKRSPYSADIIDALLLYVRALDEWNQNTAFVRLWSAVERLASPGHGDYDAVVRRCAFLWDDPAFASQTLEHLREYRNVYMHSGMETSEAKTYCFQLQQHFRPLVLFHIGNANRFKSLKEANEFLELPTDQVALQKLQKLVQFASRFRKT